VRPNRHEANEVQEAQQEVREASRARYVAVPRKVSEAPIGELFFRTTIMT